MFGPSIPATNASPSLGKQACFFAFVGGVGVLVDVGTLEILSGSKSFGCPPVWGKIIAAEVAIVTNFLGNSLLTFRNQSVRRGLRAVLERFALFQAVCLVGVVIGAALIALLHVRIGLPLLAANLTAIAMVAVFNFSFVRRWWK